jgi:hypothetical protein
MDSDIKQNIVAYIEYGTTQGYFDRALGEEIFYDDWT